MRGKEQTVAVLRHGPQDERKDQGNEGVKGKVLERRAVWLQEGVGDAAGDGVSDEEVRTEAAYPDPEGAPARYQHRNFGCGNDDDHCGKDGELPRITVEHRWPEKQ